MEARAVARSATRSRPARRHPRAGNGPEFIARKRGEWLEAAQCRAEPPWELDR